MFSHSILTEGLPLRHHHPQCLQRLCHRDMIHEMRTRQVRQAHIEVAAAGGLVGLEVGRVAEWVGGVGAVAGVCARTRQLKYS